MINNIEKYINSNHLYTQYNLVRKQGQRLIDAATVNSKEEYLAWVKDWKESIKNLESHIRYCKFMRSPVRQENDPNKPEGFIIDADQYCRFANAYGLLAHELYNKRVEMKEASIEAKKKLLEVA
jgi:hypothetical protein